MSGFDEKYRTSGGRLWICGIMLFVGCGKSDEITKYVVPEPAEIEGAAASDAPAADGPDRMLAAMVPHGDRAWFFKLTGPSDDVAGKAEDFEAFIKSVRFAGDSPEWDLPDGWRQQSGSSQMRFATIDVPGEASPLELSVIPLPMPPGNPAEYLLANVNRWRKQMQLSPIDQAQLPAETTVINLGGAQATLVNLKGRFESGGMGRPPFAGGGLAPARGVPQARPAPAELAYDAPQGWTPGEVGGMRKAAFTVGDGEAQGEMTVIDLAGPAGNVLDNVNRWRGQVKLDPVELEQLPEHVSEIEVGGRPGQLVEMVGPVDAEPREAILGAIVSGEGRTWFFKFRGDAELAAREKPRFLEFLKSVKFNGSEGGGNGN